MKGEKDISVTTAWAQKIKKDMLNIEVIKKEFEKRVATRIYEDMRSLYNSSNEISALQFIESMRTLVGDYDRCLEVWEAGK